MVPVARITPVLLLYYSWQLGYALLYDTRDGLVAEGELEDDRHWWWRIRGQPWRLLTSPRYIKDHYLAHLAQSQEQNSRQ